MDNSKNRQNAYLGVNKIGKNIRKTPLHQSNVHNNGGNNNDNNNNLGIIGSIPARQQSQPQVYNISKNDFRSIVQQLTGSPSHDPLPRPPSNPPRNSNTRLHRIRPPPLAPINRPPMRPVVVSQPPLLPQPHGPPMAPPQGYSNNSGNGFGRPPSHFGQPLPRGEESWTTPALSPISAFMQQLESCIGDGDQRPGQQQMQGHVSGQHYMQPQVRGYMPTQPPILQQVPRRGLAQPPMQPQGSGQQYHAQHPMNHQFHGRGQVQPPMNLQGPVHVQGQHPSSGLLPNPNVSPMPSPGASGPGLLPSPTSQFFMPSPGGYYNMLSPTPRSPYPLLSPGSQFPPSLSPNFAFSPIGQHGILGSGPPQPPLSPGVSFPSSPSGFFPILSPRWRDR